MSRRWTAWALLLGLLFQVSAGWAVDYPYNSGEDVKDIRDITGTAADPDVFVINAPANDPASQSGDIKNTNGDPSAVLEIRSGGAATNTLRWRGYNRGYSGTVNFLSGVLDLADTGGLIGSMSKFKFLGDSNLTTSPTLQIAADGAVAIDGQNTDAQRISLEDHKTGAITLGDHASLTFTNNKNSTAGGAIGLGFNSRLTLKAGAGGGFSFTNNAATVYGGAIYLAGNANLTLEKAEFSGNSVNNNTYPVFGGAIANWGGVLQIDASRFSDNHATGNPFSYGGAIYNSSNMELTVKNSQFSQNSARFGGALDNTGSTATLTNVQFLGNSADDGGAINITGSSITLTNVQFLGNTAYTGGAIGNYDSSLTLTDVQFLGNTAHTGGAIISIASSDNPSSITLKVSDNQTSLWRGNLNSGLANSISFALNNTLAVTTGAGALLDLRDPMLNSIGDLKITKTGPGTWKLGGNNYLGGSDNNSFSVNAGRLYLYRDGEVENPNAGNANAMVAAGQIDLWTSGSSVFTLASGAMLAASASGTVGDINKVTANTITIQKDSYLGFNIANHSGTLTVPMLTLTGAAAAGSVALPTGTDKFKVNLTSLPSHTGAIDLVKISQGAPTTGFGTSFETVPYYLGQSVNDNTRLKALFASTAITTKSVTNTADTLVLNTTGTALTNTIDTWQGGSDKWDTSTDKWDGPTDNKFAPGDIVNFTGLGANTLDTIAVNPEGVVASGMYVSGSKDYTFTGGGITADPTSTTNLTGAAVSGKLVLGQKAEYDGGSTTATKVTTTSSFSGTVDLTQTGQNEFKNGVEIDSGTLRIATAQQLGTVLSKLNFTGTSTAGLNRPTLRIAANQAVSFLGNGTTSQRIFLDAGKSAQLYTEPGASLSLSNNNGGAIYIGAGSTMTMTAEAPPSGTYAFHLTDNQAANGGAIYNLGTLTLAQTSFRDNSATSNGGFGGGAIYNSGTLSGSHLSFVGNSTEHDDGGAIYDNGSNPTTITSAVFDRNHAYNGGAIYNANNASTSDLTLYQVSFTNNTATNFGGAIFSDGANTNIIGNSRFSGNLAGATPNSVYFTGGENNLDFSSIAAADTLDMRDPMLKDNVNSTLGISKEGPGTWYLGGVNDLKGSGGTNKFNVNAGTLHLYRAEEVANGAGQVGAGAIDLGAVGIFTLGSGSSGATLSVGGGEWEAANISANAAPNQITAAQIALTTGTNNILSFDLAHHDNDNTNFLNNYQNEMLTLNATNSASIGSSLTINLKSSYANNGEFALARTTQANFSGYAGYTLSYNGVTVTGRMAAAYQLAVRDTADRTAEGDKKVLYLIQDVHGLINTWTGAASSVWDTAATNWHNSLDSLFAAQDIVNFDSTDSRPNVSVPGSAEVSGMFISGNQDYTFSGGSIAAAAGRGGFTSLDTAANGKLILGSKAYYNAAKNAVYDPASPAYSGLADFSDRVLVYIDVIILAISFENVIL